MESKPPADIANGHNQALDVYPKSKEKIEDRGQWNNKLEFVLSVAGEIIGLGNVWRFPYLCYRNGGGAFFIPYLIFLFTCGIPVFFLETALGQYTSEGGVTSWRKISPLFEVLFCIPQMALCVRGPLANNGKQSHGEYQRKWVLRISSGIDHIGILHWDLALCLLLAWVMRYFCIWKGVRSTGKVVYFTATFPYVMLVILMIRGVTLTGAAEGIKFYLYPDLSRLADPQVWMDAGTQIFFSFAICLGCLTALGSYNKYNNNCYR
ncbi:UNVERIFIED_CONTAM: hypothetical protein FKN15_037928 [Acipenser sinensis]